MLRRHDLRLSREECHFYTSPIEYLGHEISADGFKPLGRKIEALQKLSMPQTKKDLRSFLGLLAHYKRFIKDFAHIAAPCYAQIGKDPRAQGTLQDPQALHTPLRQLVQKLCDAPYRAHPDPTRRFILDTDCSNIAAGAVLQQEEREGSDTTIDYTSTDVRKNPIRNKTLRPIAFESHKLTEVEQRYSAQEKELLAICYALEHLRGYIEGSPIIVRTDHEPLKYLRNQKEVGRRVRKFMDIIEQYEPEIVYRTGASNVAADALSRLPNEIENRNEVLEWEIL